MGELIKFQIFYFLSSFFLPILVNSVQIFFHTIVVCSICYIVYSLLSPPNQHQRPDQTKPDHNWTVELYVCMYVCSRYIYIIVLRDMWYLVCGIASEAENEETENWEETRGEFVEKIAIIPPPWSIDACMYNVYIFYRIHN